MSGILVMGAGMGVHICRTRMEDDVPWSRIDSRDMTVKERVFQVKPGIALVWVW